MAKFDRGLKIGFDELLNHRIDKKETFASLYSEIKKRYPYLKCVYAYLSPTPADRIQYLLIYSFLGSVGRRGDTIKKYVILIGNGFSLLSLHGYDIAKKRGALDSWFKDCFDTPVTYPEVFFKNIVERSDELSLNKDDPRYWKKPENATALAKQLDDYAAQFNRHRRAP
jgi:hypothetical protein